MRYSSIEELLEKEEWKLAYEVIDSLQIEKCDDVLAILASTIYLHEGNREKAFEYIRRGLLYNYKNYELYLLLGNYYEEKNVNQAYLCYENAEYFCDNAEDKDIILQYKINVQKNENYNVKNTSVIILTHNVLEYTRQCINSIYANNKSDTFELIVVDNASTDETVEWLQSQKNIKLICNDENKGFPIGCNQGIEIAQSENDIFLLNNDTVLMPNSLFWLRMGLYDEENIGATGSVSNCVTNFQQIEKQFNTAKEYICYDICNNVPEKYPYEKKAWLVGFALLLKREALEAVGYLDERFSPGTMEDVDLCTRLLSAGWKNLLCWNSFIFHYGSGTAKTTDKWSLVEDINNHKFIEKWGFNTTYYSYKKAELISYIQEPKDAEISVLEIGCGFGMTLSGIEHEWSKAKVKGIELQKEVAEIAGQYFDIMHGDVENMIITYEKESFDYIIFGDVLEYLYNPEQVLLKLKPFLKKSGKFIYPTICDGEKRNL